MLHEADKRLWQAIEEELQDKSSGKERSLIVFPRKFLLSVQAALQVGMTTDQISAMILLVTGLEEMKSSFESTSLLERVSTIVRTMHDYE